MNPVLLAKEVERKIHDRLFDAKNQLFVTKAGSGTVSRFDLFKFVEGSVWVTTPAPDFRQIYVGEVTSGVFNRILADMKRAGVIGTAKGGDVVFLTDVAYNYSLGLEEESQGGAQCQ